MKKMKFGKVVLAMLAIMGLALGGCSGDNAASGTPVSGTVEFPSAVEKIAAKTVAATAG